MTRRPWLVGALLATIVLAVTLGLVELLDQRACPDGDQRCIDVQRLFRIEHLLELHPVLQWRQRPNLDATFEGTRVVTDALGLRLVPGAPRGATGGGADHDRAVTIVAYGASPDFGYGVEADEAWPAQVGARLAAEGLPVRVVNAGEIGYSSLQGTRLFDLTRQVLHPDIAVFSYVVNDVEQLRFFFPNGVDDLSTARPTRAQAYLRNALSRLQPFVALQRVAARYAVRSVTGGRGRELLERASTRILPHDYEANLRGLVERARRAGIQPVLLVMPFRLPQPVPDEPPGVDEALDDGERLLAARDPEGALTRIDRALASTPSTAAGGGFVGSPSRPWEGRPRRARPTPRPRSTSCTPACAPRGSTTASCVASPATPARPWSTRRPCWGARPPTWTCT